MTKIRTKKGDKKSEENQKKDQITPDEINQCDNFCSQFYLNKSLDNIRQKLYLNVNDLKGLKKINKKLSKNKKVKEKIIKDCKQVYCNPTCPEFRRNLPIRYRCCGKETDIAVKHGAITQCRKDFFKLKKKSTNIKKQYEKEHAFELFFWRRRRKKYLF